MTFLSNFVCQGPVHTTPENFENAALGLHQFVTKTELFEDAFQTGGI